MRARTRHPRLTAAACKVYGLTIWLYPAEFKRAFGQELAVTFRNQVEDVLDGGGVLDWLAFPIQIAIDWIRTCSTLVAESRIPGPVSRLGLSEGDAAHGWFDRTTGEVWAAFGSGIVLSCVGCYAFITFLLSTVR